MAKVSCILRHRGVTLILAYSCARPAILVAGKGRGGMFYFFCCIFFFFFFRRSCISWLLTYLLVLVSNE